MSSGQHLGHYDRKFFVISARKEAGILPTELLPLKSHRRRNVATESVPNNWINGLAQGDLLKRRSSTGIENCGVGLANRKPMISWVIDPVASTCFHSS
jgi:hypothetical protein